jgi:hypothetical protein
VQENFYDLACRFLAKHEPEAFLSWLLGLTHDQFTFHGWLDTRGVAFPGEPERVSDTVARVASLTAHGEPWVIAIEFQARPDPTMFGRLLGYLSGLWLTCKPDDGRGSRFQLGAAVVNLAGSGSAARDMHWPEAGLRTALVPVERNLEREPADALLARIEASGGSKALLPWVPLMSGGENPDLIDRWKVLAGAETDTRLKSQYATIALLFAAKAERKTIWEQKLEDWNVEDNSYVNGWIAVGEKRGEARGKEIGKEIGMVEADRASVLRLGAKRFGDAPANVQSAVNGIADRERLERIADRIFDATDWDDLIATP